MTNIQCFLIDMKKTLLNYYKTVNKFFKTNIYL